MRISADVLDVLENKLSYTEDAIVIQGALDRKLYVAVDQVLKACGGAWNRRAKAHLFGSTNPKTLIELAIETGEVVTAKDLDFFATPPKLAEQLASMADVRPGHLVLEPSAGDGAIVEAILNRGAAVIAVEYDPARRAKIIARAAEWLHRQAVARESADISTIECSVYDGTRATVTDFMQVEPVEPVDRVVMNPPFSRIGLGDCFDHVKHAWSFLSKGGVLVSVLPSSALWRESKRFEGFRKWCMLNASGDDKRLMAPLPSGSFKESGTNVDTCVLKLTKGR